MAGDYFKKCRERIGLTPRQLAERLGVNRGTVYNYEYGIKSPSEEMCAKMAKVFGVPLNEVLSHKHKKKLSAAETIALDYERRSAVCNGCKHWRPLSNSGADKNCCHYILDEGHRRPCPAENCTAYDAGEMPKPNLNIVYGARTNE